MSKNNMSPEEQQSYENMFRKHNEHVFKTSMSYMKSIENKLDYIQNLGDESQDEHLQFLGTVTYFIGLDFMTTMYKNKTVIDRVVERLNDTVFQGMGDEEKNLFLKEYFERISSIDSGSFEDHYNIYINSVNDVCQNNAIGPIFWRFKRLLASSFVEVRNVIDINSITSKSVSELTYQDVLKMNSTMIEHSKYNGSRAIDEFTSIYSDTNFHKVLKEATVRYDRLKFGTIFNESINTMRDMIHRNQYSISEMIDILLGKTTEEEFIESERKFKEEQENNQKENSVENTNVASQNHKDDMSSIMKSDPIHALMIIIAEQCKDGVMDNIDDFINGLDNIANNDDYIGNVYHYIAANMKNVRPENTMGEYDINLDEIIDRIEPIRGGLNDEYKKFAEDICAELEPEVKTNCNRLINNVIRNLVLTNTNQKQYLITQLHNPGISTYQHLTQIMGLIETSEIKASEDSLNSYVKLYTYIRENIGEKLDKMNDSEPVFNKLSLYKSVQDMFKVYKSVKN